MLLTVRPEMDWLRSIHATIHESLKTRQQRAPGLAREQGEMAYDIIQRRTFNQRLGVSEHALAVYRAHIAEVVATIEPGRLLVYDVAEGWEPPCRFLGVPVPDAAFPRTNSTAEFRQRMTARLQPKT